MRHVRSEAHTAQVRALLAAHGFTLSSEAEQSQAALAAEKQLVRFLETLLRGVARFFSLWFVAHFFSSSFLPPVGARTGGGPPDAGAV